MNVREVGTHLLSRAEAERRVDGSPRGAIAALTRVRRGWYVDRKVWATWRSEQRHIAQAIATVRSTSGSGGAVLSHLTAAAMHGWPLFRAGVAPVHMTSMKFNGQAAPGVVRHRRDVGEQRLDLHGLTVTDAVRTVADVVVAASLETALAIADAALRDVAWDTHTRRYRPDAARRFRDAVLAQPTLAKGRRGARRGRWVMEFADGRAELPGESVSRLYLYQLGFAAPRLQVRIEVPRGRDYWVDFGLDDVDAWGEFDGESKYRDPKLRGSQSVADAVLAEKWREDAIRGATGRRFVRWGMKHVRTVDTFRAHLAASALPPLVRRVVV